MIYFVLSWFLSGFLAGYINNKVLCKNSVKNDFLTNGDMILATFYGYIIVILVLTVSLHNSDWIHKIPFVDKNSKKED